MRASSTRWVVALTCLTLAALAFVAGSVATVVFLLKLGRANSDYLSALAVVLLWPLLLLAVAGLGSVGLLASGRRRAMWVLVVGCVLFMIPPPLIALDGGNRIARHIPNTITMTDATGHTTTVVLGSALPVGKEGYTAFTGGSVVAIIALFVGMDAVALYAAWRSLRRVSPIPRANTTGCRVRRRLIGSEAQLPENLRVEGAADCLAQACAIDVGAAKKASVASSIACPSARRGRVK